MRSGFFFQDNTPSPSISASSMNSSDGVDQAINRNADLLAISREMRRQSQVIRSESKRIREIAADARQRCFAG